MVEASGSGSTTGTLSTLRYALDIDNPMNQIEMNKLGKTGR